LKQFEYGQRQDYRHSTPERSSQKKREKVFGINAGRRFIECWRQSLVLLLDS